MIGHYTYQTIDLNGQWELCGFDYGTSDLDAAVRQSEWIGCRVPGDIHAALIEAGKIASPYLGSHFEEHLWLEEKEWWYRKRFHVDSKQDGLIYELDFDGLDLYAEIYLNGSLVGKSKNAFIPFFADVTSLIREGENELYVKLDCGVNSLVTPEMIVPYDHKVPQIYEQDFRRVFLRKPQFCFRWDWAQRMVTCGIWKDVSLRVIKEAQIKTVHLYDKFYADGSVDLCCEMEIAGDIVSHPLTAELCIKYGVKTIVQQFPVKQEKKLYKLHIKHPRLWMPNGYGEQNIYQVSLLLKNKDEVLAAREYLHGFRKIELIEEPVPEEDGTTFTIAVNGIKIFCKGANFVPADALPGTITAERYETLVQKAAGANFNMFRIWGGGIYENRVFYDACLKNGIMVWQDCIFANAYYPDDNPEFVENITAEFTHIIQEYRNYSALAVWCGNNEIKWTIPVAIGVLKVAHGDSIYSEILPGLLKKYDPDRIYRPSSPFTDNDSPDANDKRRGDSHSWIFWLNEDIDIATDRSHLFTENSRFCSEYGVMGHSNYETIVEYSGTDQIDFSSELQQKHNNFQELGRINALLNRYYVKTDGLSAKQLIDYSQYMQGDIYRKTIERFRRRKFRCSGSLFWMYNDCWGTTGWTIVDYHLREKGSYYALQRAYSPFNLSVSQKDGKVAVHYCNDGVNQLSLRIQVKLIGFGTEEKQIYNQKVLCGANSTEKLMELERNAVDAEYSAVEMRAFDGEKLLFEGIELLGDLIQIPLPQAKLCYSLEKQGDSFAVQIQADSLALDVKLSSFDKATFSNNFITLRPGETKEIRVTPEKADTEIRLSGLNCDEVMIQIGGKESI